MAITTVTAFPATGTLNQEVEYKGTVYHYDGKVWVGGKAPTYGKATETVEGIVEFADAAELARGAKNVAIDPEDLNAKLSDFVGKWDSSRSYASGDEVIHSGTTYLYIGTAPSTAGVNPIQDAVANPTAPNWVATSTQIFTQATAPTTFKEKNFWFDTSIGVLFVAVKDAGDKLVWMDSDGRTATINSSKGVAEYSVSTTYKTGDFVTSGGKLYTSKADSNKGNALTDTTKWEEFSSGSSTAVVTDPTAKQSIKLPTAGGELEIDASSLSNATDIALSVDDGGAKFSVDKAGLVKGANLEATTDVKTATVTATGLIKTTDNVEAKNAKITTDVSTDTLTASGKATASSFGLTTAGKFEVDTNGHVEAEYLGVNSPFSAAHPEWCTQFMGTGSNSNLLRGGFSYFDNESTKSDVWSFYAQLGGAYAPTNSSYGFYSRFKGKKANLPSGASGFFSSMSGSDFTPTDRGNYVHYSARAETGGDVFSVKGDGSGYFAGNVGIGHSAVSNTGLLLVKATEQGYTINGSLLSRATGQSSCFDADNYDNKGGNTAVGFRASAANSSTASNYTSFSSSLRSANAGKADTAHINCVYNGASVFRVRPDGVTQSKATITGSTSITSDPRLKTPFTQADYNLDHLAAIEVGHYSMLDDDTGTEHLGHNAKDFADHIPHCVAYTDNPVPEHADLYYDDVNVVDDEGNTTTERRRNDVPLAQEHAIKGVNIGAVIALHTQMLQQAHADNEAQKNLIGDLQHDIELLKNRLDALEGA